MEIVPESQTRPHWHYVATQYVCISCFFHFLKKIMLRPFKKPSIIMKWNIAISFIRSFFQSSSNAHCQSLIVYTRAKIDMTHSHWTTTHSVVIHADFSYVTAFATLISETTKSTNTLCTEPRLKGGKMKGQSPTPLLSSSFNPLQMAEDTSQARKRIFEDHFFNLFFPLTPEFVHIVSRQRTMLYMEWLVL